jgi:RHS repeat-associated protein
MASATYDAANQIEEWDATAFTYDANGNLTDDGPTAYSWNARNQLTGLSGGVSASFGYDGFGRRRSRTVSDTARGFLYDGVNLVQELASGTPTANLLTGLNIDEAFTRTVTGGSETLLADALGSTVALADGSGAVQTSYTYEPFGTTSVAGTSSANAGQFTNRENDATGHYYYRARYYNPSIQRFVSEDPIEFQGGDINLYAYVGSNPLSATDPLGLLKFKPASCEILYYRPKSCDCMWKCECPPGYMLGAVRSQFPAPCDEEAERTCFKPEPKDGVTILLGILTGILFRVPVPLPVP